MDTRTARWLQIKRLNERELERLHALERAAGNEGGLKRLDKGQYSGYVVATAVAFMTIVNERLGPYWDKAKAETDRETEVKAFERHIYPLWRSVTDPANTLHPNDLAALHAADRVIHRDDWVINRHAGGPQASSAMAQVLG